ncbi:thiol reductant ABC exporter subunit CydC [Halomonas sp. GD1P12]|uniref:thiol reductant ABC exporter subunit CydC n=1 Tax=Halomonas sp. GD1P12 TaxID=2982691 RepID=UPI0021E395FD|nr:thiol reductant ABC exporter subunit CydC [Halomonas sp. GD1P12]UYG01438.1 thiol reductant ABC exporter subunit CydC [Halomonas sp. GD1P12]
MKELICAFRPWIFLLTRRRRVFLIGAALMLTTVLAGLALLGLSGWFITACAFAGMALAAGLPSTLDIYVPGGGIRFFALLRTVARYVERLYNHNAVLTLLADLRFKVFGYLTHLDAASLSRRRAGDWLTRLTADIDTLDNFYLRLLMPPLVALLAIGLLSLFIALWLPGLAVIVGMSLGALWMVLTFGFAWSGFRQSHQQVRDQSALRNRVLDQIQASAELESYQTRRWHQMHIEALEAGAGANQRRLAAKAALGNALILLVTGVLLIGVLWFLSQAALVDDIASPVAIMLLLVVLGASELFTALPSAFIKLGASYASVRRLNQLTPKAVSDEQPCAIFPEGSPGVSVTLSDAGYTYPAMLAPALSGISLKVPAGARVAITGASGAGKSTLAHLILGRLVPSSGSMTVGGQAPCALLNDERASGFAFLSQQVDLFDATLADNLRLANESADDEALWQALERVALADWVRREPEGLQTPVGEKGRKLSGGQARRVALARLFLRNPGVVLLDEPFAGVDSDTARHLAASLDQWLVGRTAIYFVHQIDDVSLLPGLTYSRSLCHGQLDSASV